MSNCRFFSTSPTYVSFEDVSGWYGSRTGADDLWVLPKPEPRSFTLGHQPCCRGSVAADHGIQTRVPMLPYALASESTTCSVLSQRVSGGGRNRVTGRVFRTQEALFGTTPWRWDRSALSQDPATRRKDSISLQ